ncbi:MAG: dUTP diphosphatase [Vampirovibrionales bacterium]|nr:dUTP diphosphatase [Vampirovibrionales bacterium]
MSAVADPAQIERAQDVQNVAIARLPHAPADLPAYATRGSAGMDVRAALDAPMTLGPLERALLPTGFTMMIPEGYECQVRPRSGLSIKRGVTLVNCVGTIDSDYRDEVKIAVINLSNEAVTIEPGERVAQLVLAPVTRAIWVEVSPEVVEVSKASLDRAGGFGSTGVR